VSFSMLSLFGNGGVSMSGKIFVLDTNVLVHDPNSIFNFKDNDIVIPFVVLEELDRLKTRRDSVAKSTRQALRNLDSLREKGNLMKGVELENGGRLRVEVRNLADTLKELPIEVTPDNYILAVAYQLMKENTGKQVILVTKDINMRVKADSIGLKAEDYESDKVNVTEILKGYDVVYVDDSVIDAFYEAGSYPLLKLQELSGKDKDGKWLLEGYENQCILLKVEKSGRSVLAKVKGDKVVPIFHQGVKPWGISARNLEQAFALELLMCDDVKIVFLIGKAGTGKTLLALATGLHKVLEERSYTKLLVARPVIPMGQDIGYLPGGKDEKLRYWMQPITDNLELLFGGDMENYEMWHDKGVIEVEALTYIRGRSLPNCFFIIDEAQNLTPHEVKTIITRAGEGSKIILTGDPYQIDNPYLDEMSNGLTYAAQKFKGQKVAGFIALQKGERSELASLAAELL